jgi:hypothetical protein
MKKPNIAMGTAAVKGATLEASRILGNGITGLAL